MTFLFRICAALSVGLFIGFLGGFVKMKRRKKEYTQKQIQRSQRLINRAAVFMELLTFFVLLTGLIWCVYFLILGLVDPAQTDYANNIAELIVAVLTVISIIFAFVEFLRHDNK